MGEVWYTNFVAVHNQLKGDLLMSEYEQEFRDGFGPEGSVSPAAENEEELTGFDLILSENPQGYDEGAARAFYDNQGSYWDTCEPSEFWEQFEEAYQGRWPSDEDFAYDQAEQCDMLRKVEWPYTCIDWEHAARELMYDYFESGGYYFRNL
jgi:hypothetical protein